MLCVTFEKAEVVAMLANLVVFGVGGYVLYLLISALSKFTKSANEGSFHGLFLFSGGLNQKYPNDTHRRARSEDTLN